jgi:hypothetical protein
MFMLVPRPTSHTVSQMPQVPDFCGEQCKSVCQPQCIMMAGLFSLRLSLSAFVSPRNRFNHRQIQPTSSSFLHSDFVPA